MEQLRLFVEENPPEKWKGEEFQVFCAILSLKLFDMWRAEEDDEFKASLFRAYKQMGKVTDEMNFISSMMARAKEGTR